MLMLMLVFVLMLQAVNEASCKIICLTREHIQRLRVSANYQAVSAPSPPLYSHIGMMPINHIELFRHADDDDNKDSSSIVVTWLIHSSPEGRAMLLYR